MMMRPAASFCESAASHPDRRLGYYIVAIADDTMRADDDDTWFDQAAEYYMRLLICIIISHHQCRSFYSAAQCSFSTAV